jgi:hypothetical protein
MFVYNKMSRLLDDLFNTVRNDADYFTKMKTYDSQVDKVKLETAICGGLASATKTKITQRVQYMALWLLRANHYKVVLVFYRKWLTFDNDIFGFNEQVSKCNRIVDLQRVIADICSSLDSFRISEASESFKHFIKEPTGENIEVLSGSAIAVGGSIDNWHPELFGVLAFSNTIEFLHSTHQL